MSFTSVIDKSKIDINANAAKGTTLGGVAELLAKAASSDTSEAMYGRFILHRLAKTGTPIYAFKDPPKQDEADLNSLVLLRDISKDGTCSVRLDAGSLTIDKIPDKSVMVLSDSFTFAATDDTFTIGVLSKNTSAASKITLFEAKFTEEYKTLISKDPTDVKALLEYPSPVDIDDDIKAWITPNVPAPPPPSLVKPVSPTQYIKQTAWTDARSEVNGQFGQIMDALEDIGGRVKGIENDYVTRTEYEAKIHELSEEKKQLDDKLRQLTEQLKGLAEKFSKLSVPAVTVPSVTVTPTKIAKSPLKTEQSAALHKKLNSAISENDEKKYLETYQELQKLYYSY
jgi:hypothetical protein